MLQESGDGLPLFAQHRVLADQMAAQPIYLFAIAMRNRRSQLNQNIPRIVFLHKSKLPRFWTKRKGPVLDRPLRIYRWCGL
jgi:hypothetical protein